MVIQAVSDLHTEFHHDHGLSILSELSHTKADVLALAGDIASTHDPEGLEFVLSQVSPHYRHVIYVPGNHEFYRMTPTTGWAVLRAAARKFRNVYVPDNEVLRLDGKRFICGTGWFPRPTPVEVNAKHYMNDFWEIQEFEPWVYEQHARFRLLILEEPIEGAVVITHHLPSHLSVPKRFKSAATNAFFVSGFEKSIELRRPALWIHGHTHTRCDYTLGATRVVANPLGYPIEIDSALNFDPGFTINV